MSAIASKEQQRKANREKHKWLVPFVDELREVFGPGVKVIKIEQANTTRKTGERLRDGS